MENADFEAALEGLPRGYSEGFFDGRRYGVSVQRSDDGRRNSLFARDLAGTDIGVGTQNGPRYTLRFCRAFDGAHLAKRSERGGWRIGIGPEVIAGEIDMLPTER